MRTAIYGGAFNPVHNEHINIVLAAKASLGFDKIIIMPSAVSPHKKGRMSASPQARLEMCRLAFAGIDGAEVSDYEIKRGGVSYSYITCRHLKKLYPDDELFFILGADMLGSFHLWKEPEEILKCVELAVCAREDGEGLKQVIKEFSRKFKKGISNFGYVGKAVSSTKVRTLFALGEDAGAYVTDRVKKFILKRKIYALEELWKVKKYLTEERWRHTVNVALTAAEHAGANGCFEIDAITAAALHDCAKYLSVNAEELKGFDYPKNIPDTVIHQFTGAYVAEHTFGIKDEKVLNAIRYHTTGRENMGNLEKLIYLSDLLEEDRNFEGVAELRKKFDKNLNECLSAALEHQLKYLYSAGEPVCNLTKAAYEYMRSNYDK